MVRKHHKPWGEIRRSSSDDENVRRYRRELEQQIKLEREQMVRGDIDPEEKK